MRTTLPGPASLDRGSGEIVDRLRARRTELEQAILNRVHAVSRPNETTDPEYLDGLRAAVSAALDYGFETVGQGEDHASPIPPVLLTQARLAARCGVSLDTVLRRYFAGFTLLGDFLIRETQWGDPVEREALHRSLRVQATLFDRLVATVTDEYERESAARPVSAEQRHAERVERLLAGERIDTAELAYDVEAQHLGLAIAGPSAFEASRKIASALDHRLLAVRYDERTIWAWLGGRHDIDPADIEEVAETLASDGGLCIATGEPGKGLTDWRLTHHQARTTLSLARQASWRFARYADVALLASVLRDELLAVSLRRLYLEPLVGERDGGSVLRETLRAFFAAGNNLTSAAAALGVNRNTIANRLRLIEERVGHPLTSHTAEFEAALRLEEFSELPGPAPGV